MNLDHSETITKDEYIRRLKERAEKAEREVERVLEAVKVPVIVERLEVHPRHVRGKGAAGRFERKHGTFAIKTCGLFWRPKAAGYTNELAEAGIFTFDDWFNHLTGIIGSHHPILCAVEWRVPEAVEAAKEGKE